MAIRTKVSEIEKLQTTSGAGIGSIVIFPHACKWTHTYGGPLYPCKPIRIGIKESSVRGTTDGEAHLWALIIYDFTLCHRKRPVWKPHCAKVLNKGPEKS